MVSRMASPQSHYVAAKHRPRANARASGAATDESLRDGTVDGLSAVRTDYASDHDQLWSDSCLSSISRLLEARVFEELKTFLTRSSFLTILVIVAVVVAIPFAVSEFFKTGEFYLLSQRFVDDLVARLHGPGRLRFLLQPIVAIVLGARDGVKDARAGKPPFLWGLAFRRSDRADMVRTALLSVRDLIAVAILLDIVAQLLIFRMVHPAAALLLGPVLIAFPYATSRALTNRVTRGRSERISVTEAV